MSGAERREQLLDVTMELAARDLASTGSRSRRSPAARESPALSSTSTSTTCRACSRRWSTASSERALAQLAAILPGQSDAGDPIEALLAALRGYLEAVRAEPVRWRLVLMPPEGAPEVLRERIATGRAGVVAALAATVGRGLESPDPELTGATISAIADEAARLALRDPDEYPVDRLVAHAEWALTGLARSR